ncbi:MAG: FeoB-associated Cys-rich membrane protein [Bacteroidales bacterium]|nr:FeoB-associated Cys-rich membrane protein [Bacteroidales bacterium]
MIQTIIVILILLATLFFVMRWIVRQVKGNKGNCSCGCGCTHCPHNCIDTRKTGRTPLQ